MATFNLDDDNNLWPDDFADDNSGDDTVNARKGDDIVFGGEGNDHLNGQNDNDQLYGEAGDDELVGGPGNDLLVGGSGDDELSGAAGVDTFKFSFTYTPGSSGSENYTDWLLSEGGWNDLNPDMAIAVSDGEVADGTTPGHHENAYRAWLEKLVADHDLGEEATDDDNEVVDVGYNMSTGKIKIEGMDDDDIAALFSISSLEDFAIAQGKSQVTKQYYDTYGSGTGTPATVTSDDGHDVITDKDFTWGTDILDFSGITKQQFLDFFDVDDTQNVGGDSALDTVITIDGFEDINGPLWSLTLLGVNGHDLEAFADYIFGV